MKILLIVVVTALMLFSCKKEKTTSQPLSCPPASACLQSAIDSSMAVSVGTYYVEIIAYEYQQQYVYLYIEGCCDRFNGLRDENCKFLFSPSGGVAGCGDCRNPDFFNEARKICTVWKDPRI